jgi:hypothetical protein
MKKMAKKIKAKKLDDELSSVAEEAEMAYDRDYQPSAAGKGAAKTFRKGAHNLAF